MVVQAIIELAEKLESLKTVKERIDIDSLAYSQRMHIAVMSGMMTLWGVMARLTWWEYSWDVIEPCTYFVNYAGAILCYTFYLATKTTPGYQFVNYNICDEFCQKLNVMSVIKKVFFGEHKPAMQI